jgi:hypothetical protein
MTTNADIVHVGDVGTVITVTIVEDDGTTAINVSTATTKKIYIKKSDGTVITGTASFTTDGTDGKIYYTIASGNLSIPGTYQAQGYVEIGSAKYYSTVGTFTVRKNIAT